jgi:hypothetical protein
MMSLIPIYIGMEMDLLKLSIREHARIYAALSDEKRI